MGYTHYYAGKVTLNESTLNDVKRIILAGVQNGVGIKGWDGTGSPEVSEAGISLNGNADLDDDYETFSITPEGARSFCKTGRRPYDLVVGAILLRLAQLNPEFTVSSDGVFESEEDWGGPKSLYTSVFDEEAPALVG